MKWEDVTDHRSVVMKWEGITYHRSVVIRVAYMYNVGL